MDEAPKRRMYTNEGYQRAVRQVYECIERLKNLQPSPGRFNKKSDLAVVTDELKHATALLHEYVVNLTIEARAEEIALLQKQLTKSV